MRQTIGPLALTNLKIVEIFTGANSIRAHGANVVRGGIDGLLSVLTHSGGLHAAQQLKIFVGENHFVRLRVCGVYTEIW